MKLAPEVIVWLALSSVSSVSCKTFGYGCLTTYRSCTTHTGHVFHEFHRKAERFLQCSDSSSNTRLLSGDFRSPAAPAAAAAERGARPHQQPHLAECSAMWLRQGEAVTWERPGHTSSGSERGELSPPRRSPAVNSKGRAAPTLPTSSARSHIQRSTATSTRAAPRSIPSWRVRGTSPTCSSALRHRYRRRLVWAANRGKSPRGVFPPRCRLPCLCRPCLGMASHLARTITQLHLGVEGEGGGVKSEAAARAAAAGSLYESKSLELSRL